MSLFTDYITVLSVRYPRDAVMTKRLFRATNSRIQLRAGGPKRISF
jgi:hypothetical protein